MENFVLALNGYGIGWVFFFFIINNTHKTENNFTLNLWLFENRVYPKATEIVGYKNSKFGNNRLVLL